MHLYRLEKKLVCYHESYCTDYLIDYTFRECDLRVDDAARRRAYAHIICKNNKFYIEDRALPYSSNADSGTLLEVPVKPGLRSIRLVVHNDSFLRCRWAAESECFRCECIECLANLLRAGRRSSDKAYRNGLHVPVNNWYAVARC